MDGNLKKELKQLEKRKQKARQVNDLTEEAKLCNVAGELLAEHRLFEEAIEEHKMELQLSESVNDPIAVAISHRKLGECLCECQDFKEAISHQQKYLELSRKSADLVEEQRALATIGRTWFQSAVSSSELIKAQSAFLESLSICDELRDIVKEKELFEMRARLYLNLGLVYNNLREQKKGMKFIEKALAIAVHQNLKDTEYRCRFSLGEIKWSENRPSEALRCFEQARKVAQHQKKKFDEADTLVQMGKVLLHLGDFKGAKNILKKCFKTMKHGNLVDELRSSLIKAIKGTKLLEKLQCSNLDNKDDSLMKTYEDLGDLYSSIKIYSKAIQCYLRQLNLSEKLEKSSKEKAVICVSIAASYSDDKQYKKAKEYFHKELQLRDGEPIEQCDTWCNIAEVAELAGDGFEEIEKAYDNALKCARDGQNPDKAARVLKLISELRKKYDEVNDEPCELSQECKIDDSELTSEEQSQFYDEEEGDRLIEEEMEFSDSDGEQEDRSSVRSKQTSSKSINKRNEKGETALHVAAIKGDYQLAKTSIENGVSIHSRDYCGWQPLHEACNHGNINIVELLLNEGADINDPGGPHCRGMTPLHDAAQNGHVDVVKLLIAREANVIQENKDGKTPLDLVMSLIVEDDDDDDSEEIDPELAKVREKMRRILRNATASVKRQPQRIESPQLRRRDRLDLSDESDAESCTSQISDFTETNQVSRNTGEKSRKRKSIDSDDDATKHSRNSDRTKAKVAKVSKNIDKESWLHEDNQDIYDGTLLDSDSQDRISEVMRDDSDYSEKSMDSMDGLEIRKDNLRHFTSAIKHQATRSSENNTVSRTSNNTGFLDPITGSTQQELQLSERPALISENEYLEASVDADDWLIDDVPRKSSKRKRSENIRNLLKTSDLPRAGSLHTPSNSNRQRRTPQASSERSQTINNNGKRSRLKQSRIGSHVVSAHSIVSGRSSPTEMQWDTTPHAPASVTAIPDAPMRLRVKVKEKIFLIPCPNVARERKTVRWLAEQATFRYYSASGLKPILSLSTAEGASLSPDDLVTDVLSNNEQVNASVETWDLPPIDERYKAACVSGNSAIEKEILSILQDNPHLSNVQFSDMSLTSGKFLPLFRALQCHDHLVSLALPGNKMGDNGLQHFITSLPCLQNITVLNLSCNGITHKGLRYFASVLTQGDKASQAWSNLCELDVSFNAIADIGSSSLAMMLQGCPGLRTLNIESCGFGQNAFHQRSSLLEAIRGLTRLHHLIVSHNQIEADGLRSLLSAISCSTVEILDISSTVRNHDPAFANTLANYLNEVNCSVKELRCRGCYFSDKDVSILARSKTFLTTLYKLDSSQNDMGNQGVLQLVESMECNTNFKHLSLAGNLKVTHDSLLKILTHSSSLQYLDLSSCGLTSPLSTSFVGLQTIVSRHLKFLNLSNSFLNEQDLETLSSLWKSTWPQSSCVSTSGSVLIFTVRKFTN